MSLDATVIAKDIESLWKEDFQNFLTREHGVEVKLLVKTFVNFMNAPADAENLLFEADTVLNHTWELLNIGKWAEVPEERKQAYAIASYVKIIALLHKRDSDAIKKSLEVTDLGILLGYPFKTLSLTKVADILAAAIPENASINLAKRQNGEDEEYTDKLQLENEVESISRPSLEYFREKYFTKNEPVKLINCIDHWPALQLWKNLTYIVKKAGLRTVPIELGKHYADGSYSQKLMKVSDFVEKFFREDADQIGYLAQHQLFDQVPELKKDIMMPDYCAISENPDLSCEAEINAWFGPKGTISPLHFDPKHNLLCQVIGRKKIILYSQKDSEYLYPHKDSLLFNTSMVDVENPNLDSFPDFQKAQKKECLLNPGDILYIPPKYWHHVRALSNSFSVSFWWD